MRKKRSIRSKITIIVLIAGALYLFYLIVGGFLDLRESNKDETSVVYDLSSEDSNIISKKYLARIKVRMVNKSKVREPISFVDYDNKYQLVIHKLNFDTTISLPSAIKFIEQSVHHSTGYVYTVIPYNSFDFRWKAGLVKKASTIFLTMSGDSIQNVVKNDSIMSYWLKCKNLSIKYSEDSPIDISVEASYSFFRFGDYPSMNVLFIRRRDAVYLLTITPNNSKIPLPTDLLYNIVIGN